MPETWFTADPHFGHGNIIRHCGRPFLSGPDQERQRANPQGSWKVSAESLRIHDEALLDALNSRVAPADTLWILGDFCLGPHEKAEAYRKQIRCRRVNFVRGNHDLPSYDVLFQQTIDQGLIKCGGQKIWLNHYPMRSWDKAYHGSWHLYGHVHGRLQAEDAEQPRLLARDVGVDACGYAPLSFPELEAYMAPRVAAFWEWKNSLGGA